jgi:hypothetical protein
VTRDEAIKLCGLIPVSAYTTQTGMGPTDNPHYAATLRAAFPGHNWRVILDRSGERTRWSLTVDDNDPREHRFPKLGGSCVHCGKTARELGAAHDESNTDEEEFLASDFPATDFGELKDSPESERPSPFGEPKDGPPFAPPGTCPKCGGQRAHYRLKGYRCSRCD